MGHFKHVSAFVYVPEFDVWQFFDAEYSGFRNIIATHEAARKQIGHYVECGCEIVKFSRTGAKMGASSRAGFYCVTAVKHLLGVRGRALRPDGLYRLLLANGGQLVNDAASSSRSDVGAGTGAGAE